jgi:hypothetical protein
VLAPSVWGEIVNDMGQLRTMGSAVWRFFSVHLAVLALVVQVMAPAGFMPAGSQGIVLCSGNGPMLLVVGPDGQPAKAPSAPHKDSPCSFAFAGQMAVGKAVMTTGFTPAAVPVQLWRPSAAPLSLDLYLAATPRAPPSNLA